MSLNEGSKDQKQEIKEKIDQAKEVLETKELITLIRDKITPVLKLENKDSNLENKSNQKEINETENNSLDSLLKTLSNVEALNKETEELFLVKIQDLLVDFAAMHPDAYQDLKDAINQKIDEKNIEKPDQGLSLAELMARNLQEKQNSTKKEEEFKQFANEKYETYKGEKDNILKSLEVKNLERKKVALEMTVRGLEEEITNISGGKELKELYKIIMVLYPDEKMDNLKTLNLSEINNLLEVKKEQIKELIPEDSMEVFETLKNNAFRNLETIESKKGEILNIKNQIENLTPDKFDEVVILGHFLSTLDIHDHETGEKLKKIFAEKVEKEEVERNYPKLVNEITSRILFDREKFLREIFYTMNKQVQDNTNELKNNFRNKIDLLQKKISPETYGKVFDIWHNYSSDSPISFSPKYLDRLSEDENLKNDRQKFDEVRNQIIEMREEASNLNSIITNEQKKVEDYQKYLNSNKTGEINELTLDTILRTYEKGIPEGRGEELKDILKQELKYNWNKDPFNSFANRLKLNEKGYSSSLEYEIGELGKELRGKLQNESDNTKREKIINSWKEKIFAVSFNQEEGKDDNVEEKKANLDKLLDSIVYLVKDGNGNLDLKQLDNSNYRMVDQRLGYFEGAFKADYYSMQKLDQIQNENKIIKEEEASIQKYKSRLKELNFNDAELQKFSEDKQQIREEKDLLKNIKSSNNVEKDVLNKFIEKYNKRFNQQISKVGFLSSPAKAFQELEAQAFEKYDKLLEAVDVYQNIKSSENDIERRQTNYVAKPKQEFIKEVQNKFSFLAEIKEKVFYSLSQEGREKFDEISKGLNDKLSQIVEEVVGLEDLSSNQKVNILKEKILDIKEEFTAPIKELIEKEIHSSDVYKKYKEKSEHIDLIKGLKSIKDLENKEEKTD